MPERVGTLKVDGELAKEMTRLLYHSTDDEILKRIQLREKLSKEISVENTETGFRAYVEMDVDLEQLIGEVE